MRSMDYMTYAHLDQTTRRVIRQVKIIDSTPDDSGCVKVQAQNGPLRGMKYEVHPENLVATRGV